MLPAYTCAGSVSKPVTIILGWEIVARSEDPIRPLPGLPWQYTYTVISAGFSQRILFLLYHTLKVSG